MRRRNFGLGLSPATAIALVALFVALGGVGIAANGGSFILGQGNSATAQTALTATSSTAALGVTNAGTGAPLKLQGPSAQPPLIVNSKAKVANLNADSLDGVNSTGFARGQNVQMVAGRVKTPADACCPQHSFLTVPGFGTAEGQCPNNGLGVYVGFHHTNSSDWEAREYYNANPPVIIPSASTFSQWTAGVAGSDHFTVELARGNGSSAVTANVDVYTTYDQTKGCVLEGRAVVNQGS